MTTREAGPIPFVNLELESEIRISDEHKMRLEALSLKRDLRDALLDLPEFNLAAKTPSLKDRKSSIEFSLGQKTWTVETDIARRFSVSWKLKGQDDVKGHHNGRISEREVSIAYLANRVEGSAIATTHHYTYMTRFSTDNDTALREARGMVEELRSLAPSNKKGK